MYNIILPINSQVGTVPDMPKIYNSLTNIRHRFGHQSGIDGCSKRKSTSFPHGIALPVYLVFSKISENDNYWQKSPKTCVCFVEIHVSFQRKRKSSACGKPEMP